MAAIRGKDTLPELVVRRGLHARGLRFRLHARELPGRPDLVFPRYKVALFVNGCFWHVHEGCKYSKFPKTNENMWREKLLNNRERDARTVVLLERAGWHVMVVWECQLKYKSFEEIQRLLDQVASGVKEAAKVGGGSPEDV